MVQCYALLLYLQELVVAATFAQKFAQREETSYKISLRRLVVRGERDPFSVKVHCLLIYRLGDQTDPHVNGNLAVYTNSNGSSQIRYYDFVTTADNAIPAAPGANDILSDVFGNLIAFSRVTGGTTAMLFDVSTNTVSEVPHGPSPAQFSPVLGGNKVAFIDLNSGNGDIIVFDLSTSSLVNVSLSPESDDSPSLSPSGTAVVWERCVGSNCDILYIKGQSVAADFSCQDETGGSGLASCSGPVINGDPIDTSTVGSHSFSVTATDNAGNSATAINTYNVVYDFNGFFQPVDNLPTLNIASAGSSIPVKFSLSGNQGLAIFAAGFPASSQNQCDASEPGVVIEETVNAGSSSLSYNATADQYSYVWKTDRAWKGTCRMLVVKFNDGSQHFAKFRFR